MLEYVPMLANRVIAPHCTLVNFSARAVTILLLLHTSCILCTTLMWNVNFIMCAWTYTLPGYR